MSSRKTPMKKKMTISMAKSASIGRAIILIKSNKIETAMHMLMNRTYKTDWLTNAVR